MVYCLPYSTGSILEGPDPSCLVSDVSQVSLVTMVTTLGIGGFKRGLAHSVFSSDTSSLVTMETVLVIVVWVDLSFYCVIFQCLYCRSLSFLLVPPGDGDPHIDHAR